MISDDLNRSLPSLFGELVYGPPSAGGFMLNAGDGGLLAALDGLPATAASSSSRGSGTIAAHVDHLRYGLSLLNRWAGGENPFADANWGAAWERTTVSETEWAELRNGLRAEVKRWHAALGEPRQVAGVELDGVIGSIAHFAYHMGAIRQIVPDIRGPKAAD